MQLLLQLLVDLFEFLQAFSTWSEMCISVGHKSYINFCHYFMLNFNTHSHFFLISMHRVGALLLQLLKVLTNLFETL